MMVEEFPPKEAKVTCAEPGVQKMKRQWENSSGKGQESLMKNETGELGSIRP